MSARRTLARIGAPAAAIAVFAAALATTDVHPSSMRNSAPELHTLYPDHFPPGAGEEIAARSCVICHSPMLVTQQAKDSLGWEKTLALMEKWGAPVAASEHDSLRSYLMARFGPRPAGR